MTEFLFSVGMVLIEGQWNVYYGNIDAVYIFCQNKKWAVTEDFKTESEMMNYIETIHERITNPVIHRIKSDMTA